MNREQALAIVKLQLTDHRYQHTLGVVDTAIELAKRFGADEEKAEIAAIFHDYAKFRDKEEMKRIVQEKLTEKSFLDYGDELLHAPCGAYLVQHEVGIDDQELLNAIYYHTTGRPEMTVLEKVVFLADYIEPGRQFKGVEEVRVLAQTNLDDAILQTLENTIFFLMKRRQRVFPDTLATFNQLVKQKKEK
ncbi:bis(5'-nucleosyl)-tetraphosphatase (symmetrical) YqeK [Alkalihalobacillus sp. MEB130]|uniref:bis(5'-nucleosyl)-tetraphosphatase (symmetrical) YqeK n=1 Tax=Alkalihalobacillus sp. MEB130 TaxID=2976704 RepID=UPI0028DEA9E9|nr:bis(5'-nucleosyl)-tetraphosphatase (symmetrical) YqeK [Alkalihalobacillus sp. MEB130]MDT8861438.1 bis(5'-nucleosyl)-tetraphosphatase (symmetrical) YqeK [Alkalihalobacillus sp. MEB130]